MLAKVGDTLMFYCASCRKKHKSEILTIKRAKNGRYYAVGKCPENSNKLTQFVAK